ncbi:hypothetical protein MLD38_025433 [Melastoma candidum]|uniref:Uncharacterized protein n=1 Tax=Melastoma candidum TaxID=119954 RepID=A0ACB9NVF9_9MYRT|nr:hypothetical protein MLD38_025433 [Melastoma candidum]
MTAFGRGYTGGTTPVNLRGKPISDLSKTGGWIAALFIFCEQSRRETKWRRGWHTLGSRLTWSRSWGFLADAYLGRYWTIAIFTTIYLLGLTGITLSASIGVPQPNQDQCSKHALLIGNCEQAKPLQMIYLYTVLYIKGFGAAGIRPCVSSFGADQFHERSKDYKSHLDRFFNFFYLSVTVGAIVAFTLVVYVQNKHGWGYAFSSLAIAMGASNLLFFGREAALLQGFRRF